MLVGTVIVNRRRNASKGSEAGRRGAPLEKGRVWVESRVPGQGGREGPGARHLCARGRDQGVLYPAGTAEHWKHIKLGGNVLRFVFRKRALPVVGKRMGG